MDSIEIFRPEAPLKGQIPLDGSKSISNRALIISALAGNPSGAGITNLSTSKDTVTLQRLLHQTESVYDAGDAGTTFRFMTALLALQPGEQILTGSARMKERPVGPLVEGLRALGAEIGFLEKEGFPPLKIGIWNTVNAPGAVRVSAGTSSQFLTSLLLIAPYLEKGLDLVPEGPLVSRPYLEMTVEMMRYFGANVEWREDRIRVAPGEYVRRDFNVEADWSAASYWYAMAAFSKETDLFLKGLYAESMQGDSILSKMMEQLGVTTLFEEEGIRLLKNRNPLPPVFERDFLSCPDIAQTLAVVCAGLGVKGLFSGLETLSIKETDRIGALKAELAKVGVGFSKLPARFSQKSQQKTFYLLDGKAEAESIPQFATYGDHRMAMAFAPFSFLFPVRIEKPAVVEKSYPQFWEHYGMMGGEVKAATT